LEFRIALYECLKLRGILIIGGEGAHFWLGITYKVPHSLIGFNVFGGCGMNQVSERKVDVPNLNTSLNRTPRFKWYMIRSDLKNEY
jgi:hypothetical protein